ncbi:MAG TPA: sugar transferase [Armatimonadota bacterium]|jgi:lipopolysaccharide/colanic/teichoic acid biosynthesis glycosyltransferase
MRSYDIWKRAFDLCGATLLLAVTLPLWVVAAVAVLLTQGPPILYRQQRVGRNGRPFTLRKFRTMRDAPPEQLIDRPVARTFEEHRATPLGQLLRRTALDELPQLLNVLRGEMSLVGPRPLPVEDLQQRDWLTQVSEDERARRLEWRERRQQVLPGLTGLWQITPNPAEDFANWIASDLHYVDARSVLLDLRILLATPYAVLRGRKSR